MNKTQISASIGKLTPAPDDRNTSEVIGIVASIIMVMFELIICYADICSALTMCFCRRKKWRTGTHQ